jgi:uncharacterized protein YjbJ (UPF0337 family)
MDKATLKGKAENIKGRVKQAVGSMTGNKKLEAEGLAERTKGSAREKLGQAKETLEKEAAPEERELRKEEEEDAAHRYD